jgi:tetratricopeptide (TPR) repeat protein
MASRIPPQVFSDVQQYLPDLPQGKISDLVTKTAAVAERKIAAAEAAKFSCNSMLDYLYSAIRGQSAHSFLNANKAFKENNFQEALQHYQGVNEKDCSNRFFYAQVRICQCLFQLGRKEEAYRLVLSLLEKNPEKLWFMNPHDLPKSDCDAVFSLIKSACDKYLEEDNLVDAFKCLNVASATTSKRLSMNLILDTDDNLITWQMAAAYYLKAGQLEAAASSLSEALGIIDEFITKRPVDKKAKYAVIQDEILMNLPDIYIELEHYKGAIHFLNKHISCLEVKINYMPKDPDTKREKILEKIEQCEKLSQVEQHDQLPELEPSEQLSQTESATEDAVVLYCERVDS